MNLEQKSNHMLELIYDYRQDLEDLRHEVASGMGSLSQMAARAMKGLSSLQQERQQYLRDTQLLKDSLQDMSEVEKELRLKVEMLEGPAQNALPPRTPAQVQSLQSELRDRDMTILNLQSEVERVQHELESLELAARRNASLAAVRQSQSGDASRTDLLTLQSEVGAQRSEMERLESELESQAAAHNTRVSELQDCFQAKIRDLRQVHEEQVQQAKRDFEAEKAVFLKSMEEERERERREMQARLDEMEAGHRREVALLGQKLARQRTDLSQVASGGGTTSDESAVSEVLSRQAQQLQDMEAVNHRMKRDKQEAIAAAEKLKLEVQQLRQRVLSTEDALRESQARAAQAPPRPPSAHHHATTSGGGSAEEAEALMMMEQQLIKLTDIIRAKEQELTAMRLTVQAECAERADLQRTMHKLTGSHQLPHAGSEPALPEIGESRTAPMNRNPPPSPKKNPPPSPKKVTTGGPGSLSYMRRSRHVNGVFR